MYAVALMLYHVSQFINNAPFLYKMRKSWKQAWNQSVWFNTWSSNIIFPCMVISHRSALIQFSNSRHPRNPRDFVVQKMVFAYNYSKSEVDLKFNCQVTLRWRSCKAFTSHAGDRGSIPSRNRPKSLKQVVTSDSSNATRSTTGASGMGPQRWPLNLSMDEWKNIE